jgi:hypothetical protein
VPANVPEPDEDIDAATVVDLIVVVKCKEVVETMGADKFFSNDENNTTAAITRTISAINKYDPFPPFFTMNLIY